MNTKKINFRTVTISRFDTNYKIEPHPLLTEMGIIGDKAFNELKKYFGIEARHFSHFEKVVITSDYKVISNYADFEAQFQDTKMDVEMLEGIDGDDIIQFVNYKSMFNSRNYYARFKLFATLEKYLRTEAGIRWSERLKVEKMDINDKLGFFSGFSRSTVILIKKVGNKPELFQKIEEGDLTLRKASEISNVKAITPEDKPAENTASDELVLESLKNLSIRFNKEMPTMLFNGKLFKFSKGVATGQKTKYIFEDEQTKSKIEIKITEHEVPEQISAGVPVAKPSDDSANTGVQLAIEATV